MYTIDMIIAHDRMHMKLRCKKFLYDYNFVEIMIVATVKLCRCFSVCQAYSYVCLAKLAVVWDK